MLKQILAVGRLPSAGVRRSINLGIFTPCLCASVVQSSAQIFCGAIQQSGLVAMPILTAFAPANGLVTGTA